LHVRVLGYDQMFKLHWAVRVAKDWRKSKCTIWMQRAIRGENQLSGCRGCSRRVMTRRLSVVISPLLGGCIGDTPVDRDNLYEIATGRLVFDELFDHMPRRGRRSCGLPGYRYLTWTAQPCGAAMHTVRQWIQRSIAILVEESNGEIIR